jgi:ADP-ribosylglycohydrolase
VPDDGIAGSAGVALAASAALHERTGHTAGNGSLMRTAPVALAYLEDPAGLAEAAMALSKLTHFDPVAGEACVLWCLAIRHAILTGELDARAGSITCGFRWRTPFVAGGTRTRWPRLPAACSAPPAVRPRSPPAGGACCTAGRDSRLGTSLCSRPGSSDGEADPAPPSEKSEVPGEARVRSK